MKSILPLPVRTHSRRPARNRFERMGIKGFVNLCLFGDHIRLGSLEHVIQYLQHAFRSSTLVSAPREIVSLALDIDLEPPLLPLEFSVPFQVELALSSASAQWGNDAAKTTTEQRIRASSDIIIPFCLLVMVIEAAGRDDDRAGHPPEFRSIYSSISRGPVPDSYNTRKNSRCSNIPVIREL